MIRIKKSYPEGFDGKVNPHSQEVNRTLLADQHSKCYLCERITVTDYQVEHRKGKHEYKEFEKNWNNLLLSCSYCNNKKGDRFNRIIDPLDYNVEDQIRQIIDFKNKQVLFTSVEEEKKEETESTIELLNKLFNGKSGLRNIREESFFEYVLSKMNLFQRAVIEYINTPSDQTANSVRKFLDISEELLGLKYWIIKSNPDLEKEFAKDIIWNKV